MEKYQKQAFLCVLKNCELEKQLLSGLFIDWQWLSQNNKKLFQSTRKHHKKWVFHILQKYEYVCKSVGSIIADCVHNRTIKSNNIFHESFISWNGLPVHKSTELLKVSLIRHFHDINYHFSQFSSRYKL